jgi:thiol-disulfide isomerase/thioredoxin
VAGKITVVDFWADWCLPCKPLTRGLERLAADNPNIALRKVEVPTFDTAVAAAHIASAKGLPIVWIYNAAGTRVQVLEQKKLEQVIDAIHTIQSGP